MLLKIFPPAAATPVTLRASTAPDFEFKEKDLKRFKLQSFTNDEKPRSRHVGKCPAAKNSKSSWIMSTRHVMIFCHLSIVSLEVSFPHQSAGDSACNLLSCHTGSSPLWKKDWFVCINFQQCYLLVCIFVAEDKLDIFCVIRQRGLQLQVVSATEWFLSKGKNFSHQWLLIAARVLAQLSHCHATLDRLPGVTTRSDCLFFEWITWWPKLSTRALRFGTGIAALCF